MAIQEEVFHFRSGELQQRFVAIRIAAAPQIGSHFAGKTCNLKETLSLAIRAGGVANRHGR